MTALRDSKWLGVCAVALLAVAWACSSTPAPHGSAGTAGSGGSTAGTGGSGGSTIKTSQVVGTSGGTISLNGVMLTIPGDALTADTTITVMTATAPAGYAVASAAYQFGPAGTMFAHPVSVTLPLTMSAPRAHLFWSNASGGYDDLGGLVSGTIITGQVTHFSIGFAATPSNDGGAPDLASDAPMTDGGGDSVGADAPGMETGTKDTATNDASNNDGGGGNGGMGAAGAGGQSGAPPEAGTDSSGAAGSSGGDAGTSDGTPTDAATDSDADA